MSKYEKGPLLVEGKTKRIYMVVDHSDLCIIESKSAITAHDDPKYTKEFETKAWAANITTCNVFELLKNAGIPVAYREQISDTEFLAEECVMIPLEVVGRRYAVGSYLKRNPEFVMKEGQNPYRFNELCIEFFLKTTEGKCKFSTYTLASNLTVEDPFILDPYDAKWRLYEPKLPATNSEAFLSVFDPSKFLNGPINIQDITSDLIKVFLELENAFKQQQIRFIDFKIEFGLNRKDELVIADVIDNDSWRISTFDWEDLSKQSFRDGEKLSDVEKKYLQVMEITDKFVD